MLSRISNTSLKYLLVRYSLKSNLSTRSFTDFNICLNCITSSKCKLNMRCHDHNNDCDDVSLLSLHVNNKTVIKEISVVSESKSSFFDTSDIDD